MLLKELQIFVEFFMVTMGLFFVLFEIYLHLRDVGGEGSNVWLYKWSQKECIFIPFAIGAIIGHLFLGTKVDILPPEVIKDLDNSIFVVLALAGICLLMLLVGVLSSFKRTQTVLVSLLVAGVLYGHFFWSMRMTP